MSFNWDTDFPIDDPNCVALFARTFDHIDWIDGESIVQAESTPTEEGFNSRFNKIIADLEALGTDSTTAMACMATMRESLFRRFNEIAAEFSAPGWLRPEMNTPWAAGGRGPGEDSTNLPGVQRHGSLLRIRGLVDGGPQPTPGNNFRSIIFGMPGYLSPPRTTVVAGLDLGNTSPCVIDIRPGEPTAQVVLRTPYQGPISLDGISVPLH